MENNYYSEQETGKITDFHLLLFELELNHAELKSGLIQVEGRKVRNNL